MIALGVILARGGSVRVPRKNVRMLGQHPLIAWSIMAARHSMYLDETVVSSDDTETLRLARYYGATPLLRPAEMATPEAESYPALMHAVDSYKNAVDIVCLLQPTSPFRAPFDIDCCILGLQYPDLTPAIVSVTCDEKVPNGAVYVARVDWLRECLAIGNKRPFDLEMCARYTMPTSRSLDINTEADFELAETQVAKWAA